jgi:hypothetical protein
VSHNGFAHDFAKLTSMMDKFDLRLTGVLLCVCDSLLLFKSILGYRSTCSLAELARATRVKYKAHCADQDADALLRIMNVHGIRDADLLNWSVDASD